MVNLERFPNDLHVCEKVSVQVWWWPGDEGQEGAGEAPPFSCFWEVGWCWMDFGRTWRITMKFLAALPAYGFWVSGLPDAEISFLVYHGVRTLALSTLGKERIDYCQLTRSRYPWGCWCCALDLSRFFLLQISQTFGHLSKKTYHTHIRVWSFHFATTYFVALEDANFQSRIVLGLSCDYQELCELSTRRQMVAWSTTASPPCGCPAGAQCCRESSEFPGKSCYEDSARGQIKGESGMIEIIWKKLNPKKFRAEALVALWLWFDCYLRSWLVDWWRKRGTPLRIG